MWKDPIHSEEIMAMNIYSPNNVVTFLIKHKLQKTQWEINTVIIGDFNTSFSKIDEEKKLSKDTYNLYNAINKADLFDTHQKEHTFFSSTHESFSKFDYLWDHHKTSVSQRKINTTFVIIKQPIIIN